MVNDHKRGEYLIGGDHPGGFVEGRSPLPPRAAPPRPMEKPQKAPSLPDIARMLADLRKRIEALKAGGPR